ncbi:major facilitator superfamily transporter sugar [Lophium mytilinum]|uniref:Major facilitator superfamily transporter sugar n=1 Tax=Lophium mytilinum TaxID=390894 RepID=A0A6A6QSS5_9PEZI|nr:major facilitator superfamily transporter sugar [Lophium mytilinum]
METYSWYNISVVCFAAFGSLFTGYSLAVFAFTIGQPTFYTSLGLVSDPTSPGYSHTNDIIGAANGVFFGTGFFGCFLAGWAGNRFGRINGFRIAAVTGIIGGALQCGSQSPAMFLVARAVAGLAAGHTMAAMPTYFTEVSPPHSRGLITVPESPRFLVQRDNQEKAFEILVRLHSDPRDANNTFAHQELQEIVERGQAEKELIRVDGRWRLFTKKTNFRRLILACMVMIGGQNIGPLVINNYNVRLYGSLGLGATKSLLLSAVYNTIGLIFASVGASISDRLGRRKAMVTGYVAVTCVFATLTGMIAQYNNTPSKGWAAAAVTMVYLYVVCYNSFIDLNQFTIATEIFPTHLRNQASAIAIKMDLAMTGIDHTQNPDHDLKGVNDPESNHIEALGEVKNGQ